MVGSPFQQWILGIVIVLQGQSSIFIPLPSKHLTWFIKRSYASTTVQQGTLDITIVKHRKTMKNKYHCTPSLFQNINHSKPMKLTLWMPWRQGGWINGKKWCAPMHFPAQVFTSKVHTQWTMEKTRVRRHNVSYPPPQMIAFHHIDNCAPTFSSRLSIWLLILTVRLPNVGLLGMIAEEVEAPAQKVRQACIRQTGSKHTSNTTWSSQDFDVASTWHLDTKISHIECVWTPNPTSDLSMETV